LPKGVKQMLLVSEAHFFDQPASHHKEQKGTTQAIRTHGGLKDFFRSPLINSAITLEV
jgi:hypothetical protein